jgi:hypothetical protein
MWKKWKEFTLCESWVGAVRGKIQTHASRYSRPVAIKTLCSRIILTRSMKIPWGMFGIDFHWFGVLWGQEKCHIHALFYLHVTTNMTLKNRNISMWLRSFYWAENLVKGKRYGGLGMNKAAAISTLSCPPCRSRKRITVQIFFI